MIETKQGRFVSRTPQDQIPQETLMLYTFCYKGIDPDSDAGEAVVTIVAESQEEASEYLGSLLASKGKSNLKMARTSARPYAKGIVFENVENTIHHYRDSDAEN